jgi:hypothetical protein
MTDNQIILFITTWHSRFPHTDLPANLIEYLNKGNIKEYIRKFKDIYPERCDLIQYVLERSEELRNDEIHAPVYKEGDL